MDRAIRLWEIRELMDLDKITVRDVAEEAGVAYSTAYRALNAQRRGRKSRRFLVFLAKKLKIEHRNIILGEKQRNELT